MHLPPFLLDRWLDQRARGATGAAYDLGSSTGPSWTLRELLVLAGSDAEEALRDTRLVYAPTRGGAELRAAVAAYEGVAPEHVLICTGGAEALLAIFFLAAEPGANVVLPHPGFPAMAAVARSVGLEVRSYHLRAAAGFHIDPDEAMGLADDRTRALVVIVPHNPTGAVLSDADVRVLHDFCARRGIRFVCDQVYHPIYHDVPTRTAAALPHATVVGDLSKAFCLSGLRIGWLVERDPQRLEACVEARSYFSISSTPVGEALATVALTRRETILDRAGRAAAANLRLLDTFMARHADLVGWVRPQGGFTAFPWLLDGGDTRPLAEHLLSRGVVVAPGDCFDMPAHFRIGFGASGERFAEGLDRLSACVEEYSAMRNP